MFAGASHSDLDSGVSLDLAWCPEVRVFFDARQAQAVLARLRSRAAALQIALLYPENTPGKVEQRLIDEGLAPKKEDSRLLARMVRRGMPKVPLILDSGNAISGAVSPMDGLIRGLPRYVRYQFGGVMRKHEEFVSLLNDPVWRLLDPRPISAGLVADFTAGAVALGVPSFWICRADGGLDEEERYRLLLKVALSPSLGRPLALRCALIELRYAALIGDLPRYETCLRAIPDILSTRVENDALFDALTGVPCGGTRAGATGPWMLADKDNQEAKIMHLDDYVLATFSRVVVSRFAAEHPDQFDQYLRSRGLELDGPPRFAWQCGPSAAVNSRSRSVSGRSIADRPSDYLRRARLELHGPPRPEEPGSVPTLANVPSWRMPRR